MSDIHHQQFVIPGSANNPALLCPHHHGTKKSDEVVLAEMEGWFRQSLPCVAGRREFNLERYEVVIATKDTVRSIFDSFSRQVSHYEKTACLFVFNDERFYAGRSNAHAAFRFLAEQMQPISTVTAEALANGDALSTTINLRCPVTDIQVAFDDFECIAFCPQSSDLADPLYDPLMSAPYPSVNMSSDIFAFSLFVRGMANSLHFEDVASIHKAGKLTGFFDSCIDRWHKIASRTIRNFEAITDTRKCPVHITPDGDHWIAAHKDPAFAETEKVPHEHELPNIYARRVTDRWLRHFSGVEEYSASGLAVEGMPTN